MFAHVCSLDCASELFRVCVRVRVCADARGGAVARRKFRRFYAEQPALMTGVIVPSAVLEGQRMPRKNRAVAAVG